MIARTACLRAVTLAWLRDALPGVVFVIALAGLASMLATWISSSLREFTAATLSPVMAAIVLGLVWRNSAGVPDWCHEGLRWTAHVLLRLGIMLVGLRLTLFAASEIAATAVPVVIACVCTALLTSAVVARMISLPTRLGYLLAVGTAVCGCTAVVALAPVIRAKSNEASFAVAAVVLFGSLGMLCYPWIAAALFHSSPLHAGVFLGSAIHDTSQVLGAALMYSQQMNAPEALSAAAATKLVRNLSMAILIPLAAWRFRVPASEHGATGTSRSAWPGFVTGFLFFIVLRTLGDHFLTEHSAWHEAVAAGQRVSELALTAAMTAVGLSVALCELRALGWRPLLGAFLIAVAVGMCSACVTTLSM